MHPPALPTCCLLIWRAPRTHTLYFRSGLLLDGRHWQGMRQREESEVEIFTPWPPYSLPHHVPDSPGWLHPPVKSSCLCTETLTSSLDTSGLGVGTAPKGASLEIRILMLFSILCLCNSSLCNQSLKFPSNYSASVSFVFALEADKNENKQTHQSNKAFR